MADPKPQNQISIDLKGPASPMPQDYYSVLIEVIEAVSKDPAQLRKLVYAMAWHNLKPELVLSRPLSSITGQARTIVELQQTLELNRAIELVEAEVGQGPGTASQRQRALEFESAMDRLKVDAAQQARTVSELERAMEFKHAIERLEADAEQRARTISEREHMRELERAIERLEADAAQRTRTILELERTLELERAITRVEADVAQQPQDPISPSQQSSTPTWKPLPEDLIPYSDSWDLFAQNPKDLDEQSNPPSEGREPSPARPLRDNAVIILPERPPAWLQRIERTLPDRPPPWLEHRIRISMDTVDYAPIRRSNWKPSLLSFLQLVGAVVMGVALFVGISEWIHLSRPSASRPTYVTALAPPAPVAVAALRDPGVAGEARPSELQPQFQPQPQPRFQPQSQPMLPFPLPKTYGVYAGSDGQLTELQPLPIKMPDPRVHLSAEIRNPSQATLASGKVAFVVFRRDLVNSAPQTVSVRVVARVARAMEFVDGRVIMSPVEGSWRIRANAYQFKVSPIDSNREMIYIQPESEFILPAGRYALVLNGSGYDFTVAGPVTSREQCLEQVESLSGTLLSECRKS